MSAQNLIDNYSYAVDVTSVIFCLILLIIIRYVLYFYADRKFVYLRTAICFIVIGALSNIMFAVVCSSFPEKETLIYICRNLHHTSLMSCLYIFILYLKILLDIKGDLIRKVSYITRFLFGVCLILDLFSRYIKVGLYKDSYGWHDHIVSFYNAFYVYGVILLLGMLVIYNRRLVRSVRMCLVLTNLIVGFVMVNSGIKNSNTYTSFTYILPIIVVLIVLHSMPLDEETGAMNSKGFENYSKRYIDDGISMDYLVFQFKKNLDNKIPPELGKELRIFWNDYYSEASFFMDENGGYILSVPRIKKNGDTRAKMKRMFDELIPIYYTKYRVRYRVIGLPDCGFIKSYEDMKNIINYLTLGMEDNEILVVDDTLRKQLRIMKNVKSELVDIEKKGDMEDDRVLVYCQPIKNTKTGMYDTAEALMRLTIPEHGIVQPNLFIPLAESFGHIHTLTKIMLNKVCKQLKILENEGYDFRRVSVNVAVSELRDEKFCSDIIDIINDNKLDSGKIGIELTESQNENDFKVVREKISILKDEGITIYLDDFGTGYSNLDRILKLGLDVIKFDRSILLAAEKDSNASFMIQHFAEAFKQFDYKLLFEGIESKEHEQVCYDCGADYLQGFKFARPIPIEKLRDYFVKRNS